MIGPMSIDTHVHLFHPGLPRAPHARHDPRYEAAFATLDALGAASGVTRFVVVQPSFLGTDNDFLLAEIAARPARLRGVAVLDPATPGSRLDELVRAGVTGVRLNLLGTDHAVSLDAAQLALVERCAAHGLSVELHDDCERLVAALEKVLPRGARTVVDHFGRPQQGLDSPAFRRLLELGGRHALYAKVSAPYRTAGLDARAAFAALESALGPGRLLWGSDWPWTQHERALTYDGWCRAIDPGGSLPARLAPAAEALYGFPPAA